MLSANPLARFYYQHYIWKWLIDHWHFLLKDGHFREKNELNIAFGWVCSVMLMILYLPKTVQKGLRQSDMLSVIENTVYALRISKRAEVFGKFYIIHFSPMFHFYTPWKHQKTFVFLTFSGSIEKQHLPNTHGKLKKVGFC